MVEIQRPRFGLGDQTAAELGGVADDGVVGGAGDALGFEVALDGEWGVY